MMMKCVHASAFGSSKDVLSMSNATLPARAKGQLLIKVHACGLTPGDLRMLDGSAALFRTPKNGFPYIPAGDICGTVQDCDDDDYHENAPSGGRFRLGDAVVARWDLMGVGGMAEFAVVDSALVFPRPASASFVEGAALVNSAAYAVSVLPTAKILGGERVLVLGGTGGLGSFVVQVVRGAGAGFVASTGSDVALLASLGVDRPIDRRTERWWELPEFLTPQGRFDVVIDCAEGEVGWERCLASGLLKPGCEGGRWLAFVHNAWEIEARGALDVVNILGRPLLRAGAAALLSPWRPSYHMMLGGQTSQTVREALRMFSEGGLKVVLHGGAAFEFSDEGVMAAFDTMEQRAGRGNVVVLISNR
jgi:NADPH:quinone reductase-like Zn-dependent oxidoreductase